MASSKTVTLLLQELGEGRREALSELVPHVYDELCKIAHGRLRGERKNHTLNTTALVHEAYVKLVDHRIGWQSRLHFYAAAAQAMRRVLVSYARTRSAEKRGGGVRHAGLDEAWAVFSEDRSGELVALDRALLRLEEINP